ncbi:unnamed protein product [Pleuronectes platessa]|uniref:Uncharacterized protein n=1 Tax=Pleuronectes platessa TaxID=8262 RepID=A0A9N7YCQ7_PLEPL|nr:unnamed protein product [Pleuronectes platessa]
MENNARQRRRARQSIGWCTRHSPLLSSGVTALGSDRNRFHWRSARVSTLVSSVPSASGSLTSVPGAVSPRRNSVAAFCCSGLRFKL